MSGYLNRARAFCLCLLFVLLFCPLEALASGAGARVDGDTVTVFWRGGNDPASSTVVLSGPEERRSTFKGSRVRFEDLQPGGYDISVFRDGGAESLSVVVPSQAVSVLSRSGVSVSATAAVSLQLAGLDTSLYPDIALQFRALDGDGNIVKTPLSSEGFSIYEEGRVVPSFSVLSPSSEEANRTADLVVVFDNTGSMTSEIALLKANIRSFIDNISSSGIDLRYRLLSYKDDVKDSWGWTTSPEEFESQIGSLSASGGIEIPEDGFEAMKVASDYDFRPGAYRFIMLVTDAPSWEGTDENGNDTPTRLEMESSLRDNNVVLYALTCDDSSEKKQYNGEGSLTDVTGGKWYDLTGDFSSIIQNMGDIVAGTYLLSYTTPNTPDTEDGRDDVVEVSVLYDGLKSLNLTYSINLPPVALVSPPLAMTPWAGASLPFEVYFSDPDDDGISDLRFYYRFEDGEQKYIDFTGSSLGSFDGKLTVTIPPEDVPEGKGMFYSVRLTDGAGARGSFPKDGSFAYVERDKIPFTIASASSYVDSSWNMTVDVALSNLDEEAGASFYVYKSSGGDFSGVAGSPVTATKVDGKYRIVLSKDSLDGIGAVIVGVESDGLLRKTKTFYYSGDIMASVRGRADTVIVTNLAAMDGDTSSLKDSIAQLIEAAWDVDSSTGRPRASDNSGYNMLPIVVDLQDQQIMSGVKSVFQLSWGDMSRDSASSVISGMKEILRLSGFDLRDSMSLILAGSNSVVPYGVGYNAFSSVVTESGWYSAQLGAAIAPALQDFYSGNNYPSDIEYRDSFRTGRLVESAADVAALLDKYRQDRGYLVSSKKLLYLSGYDTNNSTQGFLIGEWMRDYAADSPNGWVKDGKSLHSPATGLSGSYIVSALNGLGSGVVMMTGHGNYYIMQNGMSNSDYFFSGYSASTGDVTEVSSLGDSIILSNACHVGLNFSSTVTTGWNGADFPEAFAHSGRSLGVYIANTSYGMYDPNGVGFGDRLIQNAVTQLTGSGYDGVVYDSVFSGIALPYGDSTNRDLLSRPQFYGVPTYRTGPAPASAKSASVSAVSTVSGRMRALGEVAEGKKFFSEIIERDFSSMKLDLDFAMAESDYGVDPDGGVSVHGVAQSGSYGRPALIYSVPVPAGSTFDGGLSVNITGQAEHSYSGVISEQMASSTFDTSDVLDTGSYDDMDLVSAVVDGDRLVVTVWPVQYNTSQSTLRVVENLSVSVSLGFPPVSASLAAIEDSDMDGLPDYWERGYGLDGGDPSGVNGYAGDLDGDGLSNLQEFCRGSDPSVADSSGDSSASSSSSGGCNVGLSYGHLLFLLAGLALLKRSR